MEYTNKISHLLNLKRLTTPDGLEKTFLCKGRATVNEISQLESDLKLKLPSDYKQFISNFNGLELYKYDDIGGYYFFSTVDFLTENNDFKESIDTPDWDNSIVLLCRIIGEGNYIGLRILSENQYEVMDCFHEILPSEWKKINSSFETFIDLLIQNDGEKFWLL